MLAHSIEELDPNHYYLQLTCRRGLMSVKLSVVDIGKVVSRDEQQHILELSESVP